MKNYHNKIILIPILLGLNVIVALTGVSIYSKLNQKYEIKMANGRIKSMSASELQEYVDKQSKESIINIQLNTNPEFENGGKQGDMFIANAYDNHQNMQVEIYVKEELVLKTEILKPGKVISSSGLQKYLPKGDYPAVAKVYYLKDDGNRQVENQVDMQLHVKSS